MNSRELPSLPFRAIDRVRQALAMMRHRRFATFGPGARVLVDGWILNPRADPSRIRIGAHSVVRGDLFVFPHGGEISIGEWCFIGQQSHLWSAAKLTIGDRVLISHQVNIHDTNGHPLDAEQRHRQTRAILTTGHPADPGDVSAAPVSIGDDAWIGFGVSILKGVTIGKGAIVAARSLVLKDVPDGVTVAGSPAIPIQTG